METNSLGLWRQIQYLSKKNVRVHLGERQQFAPLYMVLNQGAHVEKTRCKSLSRTSNEPHPHIYQPGAPECSKLRLCLHPALWLQTGCLNIHTKTWNGYVQINREDTKTAIQICKCTQDVASFTGHAKQKSWIQGDSRPEFAKIEQRDWFQRGLRGFTVRWLERTVLKAVGKNSLRDIVKICVFYYM